MDPIADVLKTFRCPAALFCRVLAGPPWGLWVPPSSVAPFRAILKGACWLVHDDVQIQLSPGDLVFLPHGPAHAISDRPSTPPVPLATALSETPPEDRTLSLGDVEAGGYEFLCGGFVVDEALWNPLREALPPVIHLTARDPSGPTIAPLLDAASAELAHPVVGHDAVLTRIAELLLIATVRAHVHALQHADAPTAGPNWLLALGQPALHRVLSAIHGDPVHPWTVDELAATAHMSRSAFTSRFRDAVGTSPLQYVAHWRMQQAARLLCDTALTVAEVGDRVGYRSEPAFRRAFKAATGHTPVRYRELPPPSIVAEHLDSR